MCYSVGSFCYASSLVHVADVFPLCAKYAECPESSTEDPDGSLEGDIPPS